jgi:hypothetical protein
MGLGWETHRTRGRVKVNTGTVVPALGETHELAPINVRVIEPFTYKGELKIAGSTFLMDPISVVKFIDSGNVMYDEILPEPIWWDAPNRVLEVLPNCKALPKRIVPLPHSLKIISGCDYDPGQAAYRQHSAINEHSDHVSAFVRFLDTNPFTSARQWDGKYDAKMVRALLLDADVVHCHINYMLPRNSGMGNRPRPGQTLIRHYHGSMQRGKQWPEIHANIDDMLGAIIVGARLTLCELRPGRIDWLPIPVPVQRYAELTPQEARISKRFRVAHSPTRRDYKGTNILDSVIRRLQKKGLDIELVLIEGRKHHEALQIKASCDVTFDSFWLGIQGSGIEGAAMGQPVVAGDPDVKALYEKHVGSCPYTFANDEKELERQLERLATDKKFYKAEAKRVGKYVDEYHDYPAVARIYDQILVKHGVLKLPPPKPDRQPIDRGPRK